MASCINREEAVSVQSHGGAALYFPLSLSVGRGALSDLHTASTLSRISDQSPIH